MTMTTDLPEVESTVKTKRNTNRSFRRRTTVQKREKPCQMTLNSRKRQHPESSSAASSTQQQSMQKHPSQQCPPPGMAPTPFNIPFPVPATISKQWLIERTPMILIHHLLYTRGLLPMPSQQLLQSEDGHGDGSNKKSDGGGSRRRDRFSLPPSTRRKTRQAQEQIRQLSTSWRSVVDNMGTFNLLSSSSSSSLKYILITIGPTFSQSKELYVIDLQQLLLDKLGGKPRIAVGDCDDVTQRMTQMEVILNRKLISKLMSIEESCNINEEGGTVGESRHGIQEIPIHQTLPCRGSSSFRLWLSLGFGINLSTQASGTSTTATMVAAEDQPSDHDDISQLHHIAVQCGLILRQNGIPKGRKRHTEQRRRRRQQRNGTTSSADVNDTVIVHLIQKAENKTNNSSHIASTTIMSATTTKHDFFSSDITWMSLATGVKGFRL